MRANAFWLLQLECHSPPIGFQFRVRFGKFIAIVRFWPISVCDRWCNPILPFWQETVTIHCTFNVPCHCGTICHCGCLPDCHMPLWQICNFLNVSAIVLFFTSRHATFRMYKAAPQKERTSSSYKRIVHSMYNNIAIGIVQSMYVPMTPDNRIVHRPCTKGCTRTLALSLYIQCTLYMYVEHVHCHCHCFITGTMVLCKRQSIVRRIYAKESPVPRNGFVHSMYVTMPHPMYTECDKPF